MFGNTRALWRVSGANLYLMHYMGFDGTSKEFVDNATEYAKEFPDLKEGELAYAYGRTLMNLKADLETANMGKVPEVLMRMASLVDLQKTLHAMHLHGAVSLEFFNAHKMANTAFVNALLSENDFLAKSMGVEL